MHTIKKIDDQTILISFEGSYSIKLRKSFGEPRVAQMINFIYGEATIVPLGLVYVSWDELVEKPAIGIYTISLKIYDRFGSALEVVWFAPTDLFELIEVIRKFLRVQDPNIKSQILPIT